MWKEEVKINCYKISDKFPSGTLMLDATKICLKVNHLVEKKIDIMQKVNKMKLDFKWIADARLETSSSVSLEMCDAHLRLEFNK